MPWDRNQMAQRAAQELEDGYCVNLGIGLVHSINIDFVISCVLEDK